MKKAFTIIELIVAMTIIVMLLAGSGYVFHTAVKAERTARATSEISRKLRGITEQLSSDLRGLRYDGEMFFAHEVFEALNPGPLDVRYERFDQMMFFSNNNVNQFSSYKDSPNVKGDIARIQYTLAVQPAPNPLDPPIPPGLQDPSKRILTRVQHIYTADPPIEEFPDLDPVTFGAGGFASAEAVREYDSTTMRQWKKMDNVVRDEIYTVISNLPIDIDLDGVSGNTPTGVYADTSDPGTIHNILCEGVGEFLIQYWRYDDSELRSRWYPKNDNNDNGDYSATDFTFDPSLGPTGGLDTTIPEIRVYPGDDTFFSRFGRALKFTFTLYDSYGIFTEGKTFSHIIYLD